MWHERVTVDFLARVPSLHQNTNTFADDLIIKLSRMLANRLCFGKIIMRDLLIYANFGDFYRAFCDDLLCRPLRGAWIEITDKINEIIQHKCRPLRGAWIKTKRRFASDCRALFLYHFLKRGTLNVR